MYRQFMTAQEESGVDRAGPEYIRNQAAFVANRFRRQNPQRWAAMNKAPDAATALRIFRSTPGWEIGVVGNRFGYANEYESLMGFIPGGTDQQEPPQPQQDERPDEIILPNEKEHKAQQTAKDIRDAHSKGELTSRTTQKLLRQVGDPTPTQVSHWDDPKPNWWDRTYDAIQKGKYTDALNEFASAAEKGVRGAANLPKTGPLTPDDISEALQPSGPPIIGSRLERNEGEAKTPGAFLIKTVNNALVDSINFVNTPEGATATLLMGGMTPGIQRLIGMGFSAQQISSAIDAAKKGNWADAAENLIFAAFGIKGAHAAAKREFALERPQPGVTSTAAQEAAAAAAAEERKPYTPTGPKTQAAAASGPGPTGTFVPPRVGVETGFVHYPEEGGFRVAPIPGEFARFQGEQPTAPQTPAKSAAGPVQPPTPKPKPVAPPALYYDAQGNLVQHDGQIVQVAPSVKASVDPDGVANTHLAAAMGRGSLPDDILANTKGGQTRADALAEGRDFINKGGDPRQVAERLQKLGGAARASRRELNGIHAEYDRLRQLVRQLDEDLQSRPDDQALRQRLKAAEDARDTFLRHIVPSTKTFASDVLKTFTGMHPVDAETFQGLMELLKERNGVAEVSDAARKALRSRAKGAKALADRDTAAKGALHRAVDQAFPKVKSPSVEEMKAIVDQMATDLTPCK
jgi:hypothetical protein